jgi:hypothetical protein
VVELIIILIICAILGCIPGAIASSKGRSFGEWWLYGALLFIVALIHSLCIKKDHKAVENSLLAEGFVKCPFCAEMIKSEAVKCKHCGSDVCEELKKVNENIFSLRSVDHFTLFAKNGDSFSVNDDAIRKLVDEIKKHSKSTRPGYIFGENQQDINYVKYLLPISVHEEFVTRIKYWLAK